MERLFCLLLVSAMLSHAIFGYVWDPPLRLIRSRTLFTLHIGALIGILFLFLYIFFPQTASRIMWIPKIIVHIVSVVMTFALTALHFYVESTHSERKHTTYAGHVFATYVKYFNLLSMVCYLSSVTILCCIHILGLGGILSLCIGIWLGPQLLIIIKMEAELFVDTTKHKWPAKKVLTH